MAAKKVRKPRMSKASLSNILGKEPRLIMPDKIAMASALNWYNSQANDKNQRVTWVLEYMKAHGAFTSSEMDDFRRRGKKLIPTISALARMVNNGCVLEDKYLLKLDTELHAFVARGDEPELDDDGNLIVEKEEPKKVVKKPNNYGAMCNAVEYIDSVIDEVLAGRTTDSIYEWLANNVKAADARALVAYYKPQAMEFYELWTGKDDQLNEGYSHLNKKARKTIKEWSMQLILDLNKLIENKKTERKPRKKKAPKVEQVIKNVKYQKAAPEFKLASISPAEVLGKKVLWVFNTKYRQIGKYTSDVGFTFKGTTLQNATGVGKTLRKPQEFLDAFKGPQKMLENNYKAVATKEVDLNGRINENTIFLKAF